MMRLGAFFAGLALVAALPLAAQAGDGARVVSRSENLVEIELNGVLYQLKPLTADQSNWRVSVQAGRGSQQDAALALRHVFRARGDVCKQGGQKMRITLADQGQGAQGPYWVMGKICR